MLREAGETRRVADPKASQGAYVAKLFALLNTRAMKFHRLISAFMLLLAVWFPLDNALAGAVVQGCPMMSHAFERGLHNTFSPNGVSLASGRHGVHVNCQHTARAAQADQGMSSPVLYHCVNGCEHCGLCLLLGSVALPICAPHVPVTPVLPEKIGSFFPVARVAVTAPLFRPPIA